jgi:serine/threonine protein kinase/WD40 repeat protein
MTYDTLENFVEAIRANNLLDATQLAQLDDLQVRYPDVDTLACELVLRGYLTRFQAEKIFQGEAHKLLLGQYIVLTPIGEGGMGMVFKARHNRMKRVVALKVIRKDAAGGESALQRFNQEIEAAAQLSHPNVVIAYDANDYEDTLFFVMEYVDGIDLGHLVRRVGPLPIGRCADYIRQAALGLQHAHERGMVHRDIKPSNLLLSYGDSTVKILDMGLARLQQSMNNQPGHLTSTGMVMGTPDFISPEQARDARSVDIRSDLYSLGCTFYYLLAGQPPFPEGSFTEKLLKHNMDRPQPIQEFRSEVPADLMAIIDRLMAKNPKDRYQTPIELARVLTSFAQASESAEEYRVPADDKPTPQPFSQTAATKSSGARPVGISSAKNPGSNASLTGTLSPSQANLQHASRWNKTGDASKTSPKEATKSAAPWNNKERPTSTPKPGHGGDTGKSAPYQPQPTAAAPASSVGSGGSRTGVVVLAGLVLVVAGAVAAHQLGYLNNLGMVQAPTTSQTARDSRDVGPPPPTAPPSTRQSTPDTRVILPPPPPPPPPPVVGVVVNIPQTGSDTRPLKAAFSRNGSRLVVSTAKDQAWTWSLILTKKDEKPLTHVATSPLNLREAPPVAIGNSGLTLIGGLSDPDAKAPDTGKRAVGIIAIWDGSPTPDDLYNRELIGHSYPVDWLAITPDGSKAISGNKGDDGTARVWNVNSRKELSQLRKPTKPLAGAISGNGKQAITVGRSGEVFLWDLNDSGESKSYELVGHNNQTFVICAAFSPDGKYAVTGDYDKKVIVWDLNTRKSVATFVDPSGDKIACVAIASDNSRVLAGDEKVVRLWNVHSPSKPMAIFKDHKNTVVAVSFVGDDHELFGLSASTDGTVRRFALPMPFNLPGAFPLTVHDALIFGAAAWEHAPKE